MAVVVILLAFALANCFADVKGEMDTLANQAKYSADTFMQKSVELRLGYEYRQGFVSDTQAQSLRELAQKAAAEMDDIILTQEKLKKQIENYNGDDWDSRYGDSGVWRMIGEDICATKILKCQMEYYRAIASQPHQQAGVVRSGLAMLVGVADVPLVLLVKADMYALLGKTDQSSKTLAGELYRKILATENSRGQLYYAAAVGTQKLDPSQSPAVLEELAAKLDRSECKDNFELTMSLAFLQRRLGSTAILEKTMHRWPQAKAFVGDLIVSDLAAKTPPHVSDLGTFEADCVTAAAMQKDAPKYPDVLDAMARIPRLQTPRLLNAAAVAQTQKSPARAIELFVKASLLPREPNDGYESPVSMAKQGAATALNYFKGDPNRSMGVSPMSSRCELVKRAVENYLTIAGNTADEQIEYSYSDVLSDCGDKTAAVKLLEKIAARGNSEFSRRAKTDLSALAISKSQVLLQNDQLVEAAKVLVAADINVCDGFSQAITLLTRYADKIDEYADSNSTIDTFSELGRRTLECARQNEWQPPQVDGRQYAAVLYAQAANFAAHGQNDKLYKIEKLLDSLNKDTIDILTARARLTAAQGKYEEAAKQWDAICLIVKAQPDEPPQHSYHWWQAKYFELASSLKIPNASRGDIFHSIEVLQSSFNQIPPFWDKKLKSLIQSQ
ncbi:MAG: hypothetical protein Q7T18_08365 [Sedimentisphaerales bacterium]|nr:hypothetical protein [Sedimentisphaerales bacterium]